MKHPLDLHGATRVVALAGVLLGSASVQAAGFVALPDSGKKVMKRCNPRTLASQDRCRVDSLPGETGYTLVASRSAPVIKNEVTVGTVYDRVWKKGSDYIFGMRVQLNANAYDLTGLSFNVNDLFRQVLAVQPAAIAYNLGPSTKALKKAGRTLQGLKEPAPEDEDDDDGGTEDETVAMNDDTTSKPQPVRNNGWVDFRVNANATEPVGPSSASSPWVLVKTKAPAGYAVKPFALRALNSDFQDTSQHVEIYLSGYQPN